jgi:hypothetical protein
MPVSAPEFNQQGEGKGVDRKSAGRKIGGEKHRVYRKMATGCFRK